MGGNFSNSAYLERVLHKSNVKTVKVRENFDKSDLTKRVQLLRRIKFIGKDKAKKLCANAYTKDLRRWLQ